MEILCRGTIFFCACRIFSSFLGSSGITICAVTIGSELDLTSLFSTGLGAENCGVAGFSD